MWNIRFLYESSWLNTVTWKRKFLQDSVQSCKKLPVPLASITGFCLTLSVYCVSVVQYSFYQCFRSLSFVGIHSCTALLRSCYSRIEVWTLTGHCNFFILFLFLIWCCTSDLCPVGWPNFNITNINIFFLSFFSGWLHLNSCITLNYIRVFDSFTAVS